MKIVVFSAAQLLAATTPLLAGPAAAQNPSADSAADTSRFVYADSQNLQYGRPVSKRGGQPQLSTMNCESRTSGKE